MTRTLDITFEGNIRFLMCGRAILKASPDEIAAAFDLTEVPELLPRFNIAPTDPMTIVRLARGSEARELTNVRFGLVPFWEDSPASAAKNINARSETIFVKRPFV